MYICICKGLTENDIKEYINNGCHSLKKLKRKSGAMTGCGLCKKHCKDMIKKEKKK